LFKIGQLNISKIEVKNPPPLFGNFKVFDSQAELGEKCTKRINLISQHFQGALQTFKVREMFLIIGGRKINFYILRRKILLQNKKKT